jgi:hypothetical protein
MFKCPKCSYKGSFKQVRSHYKANHSKASLTKSQEKKVYIYKVPKGFKNGRRVK